MALTDIVCIKGAACINMNRGDSTLKDITFTPIYALPADCKLNRGDIGVLSGAVSLQPACNALLNFSAVFPSPADVKIGVKFGSNSGLTGTLVVGGTASDSATLSKETGAEARGGSGTCAKLIPTSTDYYGYWRFYVPVTNSVAFILNFYHKISSGWNGTLNIIIYDTDQSTQLYTGTVTTVDDSDYHQHNCTICTPTGTGMCLIKIGILDGSVTGHVFIDDVGIA